MIKNRIITNTCSEIFCARGFHGTGCQGTVAYPFDVTTFSTLERYTCNCFDWLVKVGKTSGLGRHRPKITFHVKEVSGGLSFLRTKASK